MTQVGVDSWVCARLNFVPMPFASFPWLFVRFPSVLVGSCIILPNLLQNFSKKLKCNFSFHLTQSQLGLKLC